MSNGRPKTKVVIRSDFITSKMDDGLLVVLLLRIVIWRVRGFLNHKLGVGSGAGDTVGAKDGVEVPDDFGLKMDGALDSTLGDALDGLLDAADSADIVAKERHSGHLDITERDPHLVDEVAIHKVGISVGYLGQTRYCKENLLTDKSEICTIRNNYLFCNNCHCVVVEVGTAPGNIAWKSEDVSWQGYWCLDQDDLAATKTDGRFLDSVVNLHNRTMCHIDH